MGSKRGKLQAASTAPVSAIHPTAWGHIPAVGPLANLKADNMDKDLQLQLERKQVNVDDKYFIWKINNRIIKLWSLRELMTYRDTSVTANTRLLHDLPLECRFYKPIGPTARGPATSAQVLMVSDIIKGIKDFPNIPFIPLDLEYVKEVDAAQAAKNKREEEQEEKEDEPLEEEYTESFNYAQHARMEQHSRPNPVETLVTRIFSFELIMDDFLHRIRRTITKYTDKDAAAAAAAAGAMRAGEAAARSVGTLGFKPIEEQLTTPTRRIAYNIWFCMKSFCCVLHDKPSFQVAMYIYNTYIEGGFLAYFSVFALTPTDKTWLQSLFEAFKKNFVYYFGIQCREKIAISAKVSQQRCHDAGLSMFKVFQSHMTTIGVIFPEQEILYEQPYDTYKKQRDNPGETIPEGSIKNLISLIHGRIFDATTPWFVDPTHQFGVFCGNSFSSSDAAPQKSTREMKMFLFPFTRKDGNILKQHIDIFRHDGTYVTKEIEPIRFGPLSVFAVNTGFEEKRLDIEKKVKVFSGKDQLLKDNTKLNFYIPKALLISLKYCADPELTTAIGHLKEQVKLLRLDNEVEVSIDGIECVCVATLSGQMSQNQTAILGKGEIPGVESTIRNKGCRGVSARLIMLGEKNTKGSLLYNKVRGLISIFGKELGDIGKESEGAIIQGAFPSMRFDLSTGDWMAGMITSKRIMIMVENSTVTVVAPKGFLTLPQEKVNQIRLLQEQILHLKSPPPSDTPPLNSTLLAMSTTIREMNLLNAWNFLKYRADRCWLQQANYITESLRRISEDSGKILWPDYLSFVGCLSSIASPSWVPETSSMQLFPVFGLIVKFEKFINLVGTPFSQQTHDGIFDAGRFMEHIFPSPTNIFKIAELRSELTFYVEKTTLEHTTRRCASLIEITEYCREEELSLSEVVKTAPLFWLCNEIIKLAKNEPNGLLGTVRKAGSRESIQITRAIILHEIKETFFAKLKAFINTYCDSKWSPIYFQANSILCNQLRVIFGEDDDDYYNTLSTHGVVSSVDEYTSDVSAFIEITGNICDPTCKRDTEGNGGGMVATGPQSHHFSNGGSSLSKYTRRHTRFRNHSHAQPRTKRRHLTAKLQKTNRRTIKHSKIYRNHTVKRRKSRHNNRG